MSALANTPSAPYYAVIFTSLRTHEHEGYDDTAARMVQLAQQQPGYLGMESAKSDLGITVSYWANLESIKNWKANTEHIKAQKTGRKVWYEAYKVRIAKVEREIGRASCRERVCMFV